MNPFIPHFYYNRVLPVIQIGSYRVEKEDALKLLHKSGAHLEDSDPIVREKVFTHLFISGIDIEGWEEK